jgi:UDP-GlcNAc3NAcA epimerase
MIKILNVVGARPQIIKASALSRIIKEKYIDLIQEILVHTGQHYDHNMSEVFFEELGIPKPKYNLNIGSASHAKQSADIILGIEMVIEHELPDCVVVYGDTNSTLAVSITAAKMHFPVVHIEAGLRSFNKSMPEEINRIMCDHVATLLFAPTETAINNLKNEGISNINNAPFHIDNPGIFNCGDIMFDNSLYFASVAEKNVNIIKRYNLISGQFILLTVHRDSNTDNSERLNSIFRSVFKLSQENEIDFIIPLHPRTSKVLKDNLNPVLYKAISNNKNLKIIPPVSYLEMIELERNSLLIMTDSGGVQKESFFFKKPCIILRSETEWVELLELGTAKITDVNEKLIIDAFYYYKKNNKFQFPAIFGNGQAADFICSKIVENFARTNKN